MKELLEICATVKRRARPEFALATVIHVEGSAYRRPGARMLIAPDGESWGMISGGCLEHDVLIHARRVMKTGVPTIVRYDSTSDDDIIFGTGLGCNGVIDVFIEPVTEPFQEAFINAVEGCHRTRRNSSMATVIDHGAAIDSPVRHAFFKDEGWSGPEILTSLLGDHVPVNEGCAILSGEASGERMRVFVQPLLPPVQLVIFGGGLDVAPLIHIAKATGFQTVVVDSRQRPSWIRNLREADSVLLCSPAEALPQIHFDSRTVAVLMNHHFECDQEALAALSQISLPYLGMLGPRLRREKLLAAAQSAGAEISDEFATRLHGPAGLDIGAKTPEQIALSIMAEILAMLNQRNAKPIRDRLMPLHISTPSLAYA